MRFAERIAYSIDRVRGLPDHVEYVPLDTPHFCLSGIFDEFRQRCNLIFSNGRWNLVTNTIRSVLVLLLLSANQNDMGFDFVVAGNGGTAVTPLSIYLDVLVQREFGMSHGILLGFA